MHIYHLYILPDINVEPFILNIGAEKLLQVTEDINYVLYREC